MLKSAKTCDWGFQNWNSLTTWAHEWYFRIHQKTMPPASEFTIQAKGFKRQNMT